jgi:leucyl-tRNA synthetase
MTGVPAHDIRDWHFAKQHNIEIVTVIVPPDQTGSVPVFSVHNQKVSNIILIQFFCFLF